MSKDVFLNLPLTPGMTIDQLCEILMRDFDKTGLPNAEFDIPGIDGKKQFLLHFEIKLIPINPNERKH